MTISRRAFGFSAAALAIIAAAPASAQSNLSAEDQATLRQAQAYLTALTAAQGNFVETGPGTVLSKMARRITKETANA